MRNFEEGGREGQGGGTELDGSGKGGGGGDCCRVSEFHGDRIRPIESCEEVEEKDAAPLVGGGGGWGGDLKLGGGRGRAWVSFWET